MTGPQAFPNGMETRAAGELRAVARRRLEGVAAVYNTPARIGAFEERILPGAFADTLASGKDVLALADHDSARLLARTRSGTLRLHDKDMGLAFDLDLPDTQLGRDVLTMIERGDVGGCSIGFRAVRESWPTREKRELRSLELVEISIVHAHPAYEQTAVFARARHMARCEANAWMRRRRQLEML